MKLKEVVDRFFDGDKELAKEVKLTEEELKVFENFEWALIYDNGLKWSNGCYSSITIEDVEEDEDEEGNEFEKLVCRAECGVQDLGSGGNSDYWTVYFNRKTKEFRD